MQVVVIGAGVVGAAVAEEMSALGWTDITVLEQGPLFATGGSSSHAPGLVFQANPSKTMTELARYTVEKLCGLEYGGQPGFEQVGGLEVATTPQRLADLHRRHGWLTSWGVSSRVVSPEECAKLHPLLDPERILGGLHTPTDGLANPVTAVTAQAKAAEARGVRFVGDCEVVDVLVEDGRVRGVCTTQGEYAADIVVCCAGIWGPRVAAMVGMTLPLTPLAHQYAWTTRVPELDRIDTGAPRPILRHQDHDLYYRERGDRVGIGYYGHDPMPVDPRDIARHGDAVVMPSIQDFTPADFAPAWEESRRLLPALREAELDDGINGLFSFTTDGMPLIGESPDVGGFWVAEAVWVTHSAGVARAVAEWIVTGAPSVDLHDCDVNRFEQHQLGPDYVLARGCQNFVEVYDVLHPLQPMEAPRPLRTSPFYPRQVELGAVFLEASGWERPQWYAANEQLLVEGHQITTPNVWAAGYWSPIVGAEAQATRERVALYDMTALKRIEVTGPGATAYLQWLTTGNVDKSVGSVTYCLLLDERGRIRSDITVSRLGPDRYQVGANGNLDLDWFSRYLPSDHSVDVRDITAWTCCLGVWGPHARGLLQRVSRDDFSASGFKYFRAKQVHVGMVPTTALRLSYVGELGYELYTTADMGLKLWDTLWEAGQDYGIFAGGRGAFTSLRLEKGYRSFGSDMTWDHHPDEAGLGFAVRMDKSNFLGRTALADASVRSRLACLTIADPAKVVLGSEPVYDGDRCVGYVTSAAYGYTVGLGIAYAWLPPELSKPGSSVHIGYFDERIPATVTAEPLFDPDMTRLRS
ncbi:MAG: FAD-dependent oxidoreductase [Actinomycetota bacterium]|nr:FAD-dependent oxidoreductase [Actinomycetota bacterium]